MPLVSTACLGIFPLLAATFFARILAGDISSTSVSQMHAIDMATFGIVNRSIPLHNSSGIYHLFDLSGFSSEFRDNLFSLYVEIGHIVFQKVRLDMYDARGALIEADRCSVDFFESRDIRYFANLEKTRISFLMNSMYLERPICPFLFKNAFIDHLALSNYGNKILYRNRLSFYEIRNPRNLSFDLNAQITRLTLMDNYREHLTADLFGCELFAWVPNLFIQGSISRIDEGFLRNFKRLVSLQMVMLNTGSFFQSSNNEWLRDVFGQGRSFPSQVEKRAFLDASGRSIMDVFTWAIYTESHSDNYTFPDEDFCLFKHFPWHRSVSTLLQLYPNVLAPEIFSNSRNTSCTFRFLSLNNALVQAFFDKRGYDRPAGATFDDSLLNECNFDAKILICVNFTGSVSRFSYDSDGMDVLYALEWMEYIGPIITFPIFSALAFMLNMLIILVIRSKKNKTEKLFEAKSFRFMEMNSAFNCVECLIYQFKLMGICLGTNSVFCSTIRDSTLVVYLGVFNYYLSEVMKSCSMMTGLLFSIQRFVEASSKTNTNFFAFFSRISVARFALFVLVYSLIISIPVLSNVNYHNIFLNSYDTPTVFFLESSNFRNQKTQTYFFFAHYIVNDLLVLVVNLAVDCCLVRHVKADLRQKLLGKVRLEGEASASDKKLYDYDRKIWSVERKANTMIILSVVIYILCRVPELIGVFFVYFYRLIYPRSGTCSVSLVCYLISNSIEYMYMLSYFSNLLLYYKFNSYFRKGLRNYLG